MVSSNHAKAGIDEGGWSVDGCKIVDCAAPRAARGLCRKHYQRWRVWGDPLHQDLRRLTQVERQAADGEAVRWSVPPGRQQHRRPRPRHGRFLNAEAFKARVDEQACPDGRVERLSMRAIATQIGVSPATLSRWLGDTRAIPRWHWQALATANPPDRVAVPDD
jgi:hypothetical protein